MTDRDVAALVHQLRTAARAADRLAAHLVDQRSPGVGRPGLHGLAFEKHVAGVERTSGGPADRKLRASRGEHVPVRLVEQPPYPGGGR